MSVFDINGDKLCGCNDLSELDDLLPDRLLVWHDEFRGQSLDSTKWSNMYGKGLTSIFEYAEDIKRTTTSGSGLSYRCIKDYPNNDVDYSSAYIYTQGKFEFRYGRIEAKMRFPNVSPHHSTFWTLGSCVQRKSVAQDEPWETTKGVLFPSCGEIDIAEFDDGSAGARTHWATLGFDKDSVAATGGNINSLTNTPAQWHIYACEWTNSTIKFFCDGVEKISWNISNATVDGWNPFKIPHFIIFNCVVSISGSPTWSVAQTDVAWVRVYAPVGVTEFIRETGISIDSTASITVGQRKWLAPTFTPANPSDMTLNWMSHNEDIVTCYGGMLIGVSAGTTYVQCTTKHGFTALCKVVVS